MYEQKHHKVEKKEGGGEGGESVRGKAKAKEGESSRDEANAKEEMRGREE